jgi:hypothetical protein
LKASKWLKQVNKWWKKHIFALGYHDIPQDFDLFIFDSLFWSTTASQRTFENHVEQK